MEAKRRKGQDAEVDKEELEVDPMNPPVPGGRGKPRSCRWKGGESPFHDGGGLSSPGRWRKKDRVYPHSKAWEGLRRGLFEAAVRKLGGEAQLEKEFFRMTKGDKGFSLVKDEEFLGEVRRLMVEEFELAEDSEEVAEGQPFLLEAIEEDA